MKHNANIFVLGLLLSIFYGCASLSSFQDAKTLKKGKAQAYAAVTKYAETFDGGINILNKDTIETLEFWVFDLGGRFGITNNIDLGLKYTIPGGLVGDIKYMFTDHESKLGVSTGGKIGYMNISTSASNSDEKSEYTVLDFGVPLYFSYYPINWLSLTVNPTALYRSRYGDNTNLRSGIVAGGTGNIKLGKTKGVMVEAGYFKDMRTKNSYMLLSALIFSPINFDYFLGDLIGF